MKILAIGILGFISISAFAGDCLIKIEKKGDDQHYNFSWPGTEPKRETTIFNFVSHRKFIYAEENAGKCNDRASWFIEHNGRSIKNLTSKFDGVEKIWITEELITSDAQKFLKNGIISIDENTDIIYNPTDVGTGLSFANAYFAPTSSEHGVCKALGYNQAVPLSSRNGYFGNTLQVDGDGKIFGGNSSDRMAQITCKKSEKTIILKWPIHPETKLYFSEKSIEDGICKALGHERAIKRSSRTSSAITTNTLVNVNGEVVEEREDRVLEQIVCVKKQ